MLINNAVYKRDLEFILSSQLINWTKLQDKTVFVTGATGLIGALIVATLLEANQKYGVNCRVIASIRNQEKARMIFGEDKHLELHIADIRDPILYSNGNIDYMVHTASLTDSKSFVLRPVETIETILKGTENVLQLAKANKVNRTVFLSTMEVYGAPLNDNKIDERHGTNLQTADVRSCYPISKMMSEQMFASFCAEYGISGAALRLTQTFGPGVVYSDGRVFAEFARCVIENREIVLRTEGLTKRMYLYTADAVNAILHIMLEEDSEESHGSGFEVYNVANESTYCSIREMANQFSEIGGKNTSVRIQADDVNSYGYAPTLHMNLDTRKIIGTGWRPQYGFRDMIVNLIDYMNTIKP